MPQNKKNATALSRFQPATRQWFAKAFTQPTPAQLEAWSAISAGDCTLVIAPTGSGKTLAAFLHAIDQLFEERQRQPERQKQTATRVVYISPIKALGTDVRRNLSIPLDGVNAVRGKRGDPPVELTVGMRTGDTPVAERARLLRRPPDILITTPESLYLMLTSRARETLRGVTTVIVDEIHAVAGTKRGSHLALSLERLDALLPAPAQRIGLSATVRPAAHVARFLGGAQPVTLVNPPSHRPLDIHIVVPVADMTDIPARDDGPPETRSSGRAGSIWPHVEASILDEILRCRSTIVFTNSRGLAEKLTARLNEGYSRRSEAGQEDQPEAEHYLSNSGGTGKRASGELPTLARSHHGSVSKEQRAQIEAALKSGELRCVVATSSLELGIDMGLVDNVIQVGAPPSVASALQRVGRAGHQVGGRSTGVFFPRTRFDLIETTVTVERMLAGKLEAIAIPRNPLDVLAQHTVAAVAMEPLDSEQWFDRVRRAEPFRALPRSAFDATLDMLSGRYPSEAFSEFRPRLLWDRDSGLLTARPGAQQLSVTSGGTIPDRGMYSVVLPEGDEQRGARRVGELDEEMVYESRVNDVITLGASSWRIQQITHDQVVVVPAPGRSARLPFWHGEKLGRPAELGQAIGAFIGEIDKALPERGQPLADDSPMAARLRIAGLNPDACTNLLDLVVEQRESTGAVPTDQTLVIERCRDESGDWRVMLHSPYGQRVHAPWGLAIAARVRQRWHIDPTVVASDDGIIIRLPDAAGRLPGAELFVFDSHGMLQIITDAVGQSALFAARFRECAARALLLPRRRPGKRSPLWQQRLRASQLLEIAREHHDFPLIIETARECLQDVYDLNALQSLMQRLHAGSVQLLEVTTETPSPFAANLLFGYVIELMYQGDVPVAEHRASMLQLDSGLLGELLGQVELGELVEPGVVAQVEQELQRTAKTRQARGLEGLVDLLRELGPLNVAEIAARMADTASGDSLAQLEAARRIIQVRIAGEPRWASIEDAARLRDALGCRLPPAIPRDFLQSVNAPLRDLLSRYARTHGPFTPAQMAARFGLGIAIVNEQIGQLRSTGQLIPCNVAGKTRQDAAPDLSAEHIEPGESAPQWVWDDVFRRLRARSLQAAREATQPVPRAAYVQLILERQGVLFDAGVAPKGSEPDGAKGAFEGVPGLARVIELLAGVALPASLWESQVLPARVQDYRPAMLDELMAAGQVMWAGHEASGDNDGLISLHLRDNAGATLPLATADPGAWSLSPLQQAMLSVLADGGAYFVPQLAQLAQARLAGDDTGPSAAASDPADVAQALWDLAWHGQVTSDTWSPLRLLTGSRPPVRSRPSRPQRHRRQVAGWVPVWQPAKPQPASSIRSGEAAQAGRWALLSGAPVNPTLRAVIQTENLFDRYGVISRGVAIAEQLPGGFPALQPVLRQMEQAGRVLRGRFITHLGAAQFADKECIERLRELAQQSSAEPVALAAGDPANAFGWLLPWPVHPSGMRPTRRAGALVVICQGRLSGYLTQSGRQLLTFFEKQTDVDADRHAQLLAALTAALKREQRRGFTLESIDGQSAQASPLAKALPAAGFSRVPQGYAWYG